MRSFFWKRLFLCRGLISLKGIKAFFTGTDFNNIFYIIDEDLSVTQMPGIKNLLYCINYIGNATTFLSMSLLGCSFAAISLKALFANRDLYLFSVIKMLLIPLGIGYLMKIFGVDERMLEAFVLMLAMPAANLPLMMAKKNGEDTQILTQGILLTTMLTPVTLTLVTFLISRM